MTAMQGTILDSRDLIQLSIYKTLRRSAFAGYFSKRSGRAEERYDGDAGYRSGEYLEFLLGGVPYSQTCVFTSCQVSPIVTEDVRIDVGGSDAPSKTSPTKDDGGAGKKKKKEKYSESQTFKKVDHDEV